MEGIMTNNTGIDAESAIDPSIDKKAQAVLIGGMPRSGTTVLCDILNEHDDVAIWAEYPLDALIRELSPLLAYGQAQTRGLTAEQVQANLAAGLGAGDPGDQTMRVVPEENGIYNMHGSRGLRYPRRFPLEDRLPAIVASVVSTALGKAGASIVGSKDPLFFINSNVGQILHHFPDARFVMCIRAPLDQINSSANRRNRATIGLDEWQNKPVAEMAADYLNVVRHMAAYAARFGDRLMIVKYEDVVSNASRVLAELERFLGIQAGELKNIVSRNQSYRDILTDEERETLTGIFVDAPADWTSIPLTGIGLEAADHLAPFLYGDIEPTGHVRYDVPGERRCLGHGWGEREDTGRWSIQQNAEILFAARTPGPRLISLGLAANLPFISSRIRCRITMNEHVLFDGFICKGTRVGADPAGVSIIALPGEGGFDTIILGPVPVESGRLNILRFQFPGIQSPLALGLSQDPRPLAIKLQQFGLIDLSDPA